MVSIIIFHAEKYKLIIFLSELVILFKIMTQLEK